MKASHSVFLSGCFALASALGGETVIKDAEGMDCFVYTPDPIVPETTYQLVVGVHGANGKGNGAAGMQGWAKRGDVIVIGPSFVSKGERSYQNGDGVHAEKLIALFETLKKEHKLKDKPGSAKLLKQCERAANLWYAAAKTNGLWKGAAKDEFKRYTQGLEIETEE